MGAGGQSQKRVFLLQCLTRQKFLGWVGDVLSLSRACCGWLVGALLGHQVGRAGSQRPGAPLAWANDQLTH